MVAVNPEYMFTYSETSPHIILKSFWIQTVKPTLNLGDGGHIYWFFLDFCPELQYSDLR